MVAKILILALAVVVWQADSQQCGGPVYQNPLRSPLAAETSISTGGSSFLPSSCSTSETSSSILVQTNSMNDEFSQPPQISNLDRARAIASNFNKGVTPDAPRLSPFSNILPSTSRNVTSLVPNKCNVPSSTETKLIGKPRTIPIIAETPKSSVSEPWTSPLRSQLSSFRNQNDFSRPNQLLEETKQPYSSTVSDSSKSFLISCGSSKPTLGEILRPTTPSVESSVLPFKSSSLSCEPQVSVSPLRTYNSPNLEKVTESVLPIPKLSKLPVNPSLKSSGNCKSSNIFGPIPLPAQVIETVPSKPVGLVLSPELPNYQTSSLNAITGANSAFNDALRSSFDCTNNLEVKSFFTPQSIATADAGFSGVSPNISPFKPITSPSSAANFNPATRFPANFWDGISNPCNPSSPSIPEMAPFGACNAPIVPSSLGSPCFPVASDVANPLNVNPRNELSSNKFGGRNLVNSGVPVTSNVVNFEPPIIFPCLVSGGFNNAANPSQNIVLPDESTSSVRYDSSANLCRDIGNYVTPNNIGPLREISPTPRGLKEVLGSLPGNVAITGITNFGRYQPCYVTPESTVSSSTSAASSSSSTSTSSSSTSTSSSSLSTKPSIPISDIVSQSNAQASVTAGATNSLPVSLGNAFTQIVSNQPALGTSALSSTSVSTPYSPTTSNFPVVTDYTNPFINTVAQPSSFTQSSVSLAEASSSASSDLVNANSAATSSASTLETPQFNPFISNPYLANYLGFPGPINPCIRKELFFTEIPQTATVFQTSQSSVNVAEATSSVSPGIGQIASVASSVPGQINPSLVDPFSSNNLPGVVSPTISQTSVVPANTASSAQSSVSVAETSTSISSGLGQAGSTATSSNVASQDIGIINPTLFNPYQSNIFGYPGMVDPTYSCPSILRSIISPQISTSVAESSSSISSLGETAATATSLSTGSIGTIIPTLANPYQYNSELGSPKNPYLSVGPSTISSQSAANVVEASRTSISPSLAQAISSSSINSTPLNTGNVIPTLANPYQSNVLAYPVPSSISPQSSVSVAESSNSASGLGLAVSSASSSSATSLRTGNINSPPENTYQSNGYPVIPTAIPSQLSIGTSDATNAMSSASVVSSSNITPVGTTNTNKETSIEPSSLTQLTAAAVEATSSTSSSVGQASTATSSITTTPLITGQVNPIYTSPTCSDMPTVLASTAINTQSAVSASQTNSSVLPSIEQTSTSSTSTTETASYIEPVSISPITIGSSSIASSTTVAESTTSSSTSFTASETMNSVPMDSDLFVLVKYLPDEVNLGTTASSVAISKSANPVLTSYAASEVLTSAPVITEFIFPVTPVAVEVIPIPITETSSASTATASSLVATPSSSVSTTSTATDTVEQSSPASIVQSTSTSATSASSTSCSCDTNPSPFNYVSQPSQSSSPTLAPVQSYFSCLTPSSQNMYNVEINPVTLEVQLPSNIGSLTQSSFGNTLSSASIPSLMYELQLPSSIPAEFECSFESLPVFYTAVESVPYYYC